MLHKFHYSRPLRVVAGNGGGLPGRGLCELVRDCMISGIGDSKTSGVGGSVPTVSWFDSLSHCPTGMQMERAVSS